ncbi:MAG: ATP synthase subunit I [Candidatus Rokubacteria bacterium]|nr:ATP synthase subunit I [Candidatus Rokubacteria bacterium]
MGNELVGRVMGVAGTLLVLLALGGFLVAGAHAGLSILAGGAVALGNLWLLTRGAERALRLFAGRRVHPLWVLGVGARHLALFGLLGVLLWGDADPVGLILGLSVLPPVLIAAALRGSAS